jgi:hypothetical protein
MGSDHLTSFQLLEHLKKDPSNFDILSQVAEQSADPKHEVAICNGMLVLFGAAPIWYILGVTALANKYVTLKVYKDLKH